jgi:hypothetical protein
VIGIGQKCGLGIVPPPYPAARSLQASWPNLVSRPFVLNKTKPRRQKPNNGSEAFQCVHSVTRRGIALPVKNRASGKVARDRRKPRWAKPIKAARLSKCVRSVTRRRSALFVRQRRRENVAPYYQTCGQGSARSGSGADFLCGSRKKIRKMIRTAAAPRAGVIQMARQSC